MGLLWGLVTPTRAVGINRNDAVFGHMAGGGSHVQASRPKAAGRALARLLTPSHQPIWWFFNKEGELYMLGISFFSNKVAKALFRKGYTPQDLPPIKNFKPLCDALKANGYDADIAADLWDKCLQEDKSAIKEMHENTGAYGIMLFGPLDKSL